MARPDLDTPEQDHLLEHAHVAGGRLAVRAHLSGELRAASFALTGKLQGSDGQPQGGRVELRWGAGRATLEVPEADAITLALQDFDLAPGTSSDTSPHGLDVR